MQDALWMSKDREHCSAVPDVRISSWGDRHQPLPVSRPDPWRWALCSQCPWPCQESGRNGWGFFALACPGGGGLVMCTTVLVRTWLPPLPQQSKWARPLFLPPQVWHYPGYHVDINGPGWRCVCSATTWPLWEGMACMTWVLPGPPSLPPSFFPGMRQYDVTSRQNM